MSLTEEWLRDHWHHRSSRVQELADGEGLSARVTALGKIVFQMRYVCSGVPRRLDLGVYPQMSLVAARAENERLRRELQNGRDPKLIRLAERQMRLRAETTEELFRAWYDEVGRKVDGEDRRVLKAFELYVFPRVGAFPPAKVTFENWIAVFAEAAQLDASIAGAVFANSKRVLAWAEPLRLIPTNVLARVDVRKGLATVKNEAKSARDALEISPIRAAVEKATISGSSKKFLELCLALVVSMERAPSKEYARILK